MFQIVCNLQIEDILIKKNSERYSKKTARRYRKKMQKDRVEKKMQEDVGKKCRRKRCKFIFYYIFYLKVEGSFILFGGLLAQFSDAFAFFFYFWKYLIFIFFFFEENEKKYEHEKKSALKKNATLCTLIFWGERREDRGWKKHTPISRGGREGGGERRGERDGQKIFFYFFHLPWQNR